MKKSITRKYQSEIRAKNAEETKLKITKVAQLLFNLNGYDATTIEQIAKNAEVAIPTVYAVFGSKKEIVKTIIEQVRLNPFVHEFTQKAQMKISPEDRLKLIANFVRNINEAYSAVYTMLRIGHVSTPEIVELEQERNQRRYESQKKAIVEISNQGRLKKSLSIQKGCDILWALTSPDLYHLLTVDRSWKTSEYELWLFRNLEEQLLE